MNSLRQNEQITLEIYNLKEQKNPPIRQSKINEVIWDGKN
jgi:hypothetical protein